MGLHGEILSTGGRAAEGVGELRQALTLGEAIACPSLTWRLAQTLGRTCERQGDIAQAHAMYETAHIGVIAVAGRIADERLREWEWLCVDAATGGRHPTATAQWCVLGEILEVLRGDDRTTVPVYGAVAPLTGRPHDHISPEWGKGCLRSSCHI